MNFFVVLVVTIFMLGVGQAWYFEAKQIRDPESAGKGQEWNSDDEQMSNYRRDYNPAGYCCLFAPGDGSGGSEEEIGTQTGYACVEACIARKNSDDTINGVTTYIDETRKGCWCEKRMTGYAISRKYKTCPLNGAFYARAGVYCCQFMPGDGSGGSEEDMGALTIDECIETCIAQKKSDYTINGVTVHRDETKGCWCEKSMTSVAGSSKYKTCLLSLPISKSGDSTQEENLDDDTIIQKINDLVDTVEEWIMEEP